MLHYSITSKIIPNIIKIMKHKDLNNFVNLAIQFAVYMQAMPYSLDTLPYVDASHVNFKQWLSCCDTLKDFEVVTFSVWLFIKAMK